MWKVCLRTFSNNIIFQKLAYFLRNLQTLRENNTKFLRLRMRNFQGPMDPKYKFWYLSSLRRCRPEFFTWHRYQSYLSVDMVFLATETICSALLSRLIKHSQNGFFFKTLEQSMIILEGHRLIWCISFMLCLVLILKFLY